MQRTPFEHDGEYRALRQLRGESCVYTDTKKSYKHDIKSMVREHKNGNLIDERNKVMVLRFRETLTTATASLSLV